METKTDLRVVKTKKAIKEAFIDMRRTIPLEKIRVRDLCKHALINKSTFYAHYTDPYDLSDQLENETLKEFLDKFTAKDCLFTDPVRFLSEIPKEFDANQESLYPLFKGRLHVAFQKIPKMIAAYYATESMDDAEMVRLDFVLGGTLCVLQEAKMTQKYDTDTLIQNVSPIIRDIKQIGVTEQ